MNSQLMEELELEFSGTSFFGAEPLLIDPVFSVMTHHHREQCLAEHKFGLLV